MNTVKGFVAIPALENNVAGQTALFGELSTWANTFSRNKSVYVNVDDAPGISFVGFTTKNTGGSHFVLPAAVKDHVLNVAYWVYQQHLNSLIPTNTNKAAFITALGNEFPDMVGITINEILNGSPTVSQRMPDYIDWTYTNAGTGNQIKIWFADSRFRTQYDDFEILVIPPIPTIDNLINTSPNVNALLQNYRPWQLAQAIDALTAQQPYTQLITREITWNSPSTPGPTLRNDWTLLVYGPAGADNDAVKNAIRDYITGHSTSNQWGTIYPTLYAENEFVVIPFWNDIAVEENGLDPGIYSTAVRAGKMVPVATAMLPPSYAQAVTLPIYLAANLISASTFFRSLAFMIVGNPSNQNSKFSMKQIYPDYSNIDSTSMDWGRLSLDTRAFITHLNEAMEKALTLTDISPVPAGYSRIVRNGKVYLSFVEGDFNYLVLTNHSYAE